MLRSDDRWVRLSTVHRRMPPEGVFACSTAAWIHGLDAPWKDVIEIALPKTSGRRSHTGLTVHRSCLTQSDVIKMRGLPVTTLHRTLRDLCLFGSPIEALITMDSALHKRRTNKEKLLRDPLATKGRRGAARLRKTVELAAPAESPMETRLRWLLITAGLPAPEVQVDLHDGAGEFIGRADLYYPAARVVIEYDGGNHRDRLVSDDQRQNLVVNAGFRVLRFTATDVYTRPDVVIAQVRGALTL